ncbi:hypothetical protein HHI36_021390 [Cryptolaemus montrouzieri]|uniref:Uncharacterized protein n=1 Tax=Cryptolaemus montrouzieri TaxID=559131 RepID=A0ABD2MXE8_9CUCU
MYTLQMCKESYGVYIFSFGANFKTQYDPNYLLKECVVTSTLNYLTSIFDCIKTFGGDSENVILFGEIVEFTSVSLLFYDERTTRLHHRVILENEVSSSLLLRTKKPLSRRNL